MDVGFYPRCRALGGYALGPDFYASVLDDRSAHHAVAALFFDGFGFARHRDLIYACGALHDIAVDADALARADNYDVAHLDVGGRYFFEGFFTVIIYLDPDFFDIRAGQLFDEVVATVNGAFFHVFADS